MLQQFHFDNEIISPEYYASTTFEPIYASTTSDPNNEEQYEIITPGQDNLLIL